MGIRDSCVYRKVRPLLAYGFFGVLTTAINIASYWVTYDLLRWPNVLSNVAAWVLSVSFAFITNKLWVFDSKSLSRGVVFSELWKFVAARLGTGLVDLVVMWLGVDVLGGPAVLLKVVANAVVIVLNFVLSKLVVFRSAGNG